VASEQFGFGKLLDFGALLISSSGEIRWRRKKNIYDIYLADKKIILI
jgi:hypothetical protein